VVISSVLDTPVLTPAVEAAGEEPRLSSVRVAGNPSLVVRPAEEGPWPAIFLVNGTVPEGRKLTVTGALDHAKLNLSLEDIPAIVSFDAFVLRSLRTARA